MFWKKNPKQPVQPVETISLDEAVRFIVDNGYGVSLVGYDGSLNLYTPPSSALNHTVRTTLKSLEGKSPETLLYWKRTVERELEREALAQNILDDIANDHLEANRSRAMVKAVNAGLDRSEAFYKLVKETKLKEILSIERWIDRSDAYQSYLALNR